MKSYYDLIRDNLIEFDKVLLDNYYQLGLSEIECIVLLRLHQYKVKNNNILNADDIIKKMSISSDSLTEIIADLVSRSFIDLTLDLDDNQVYTERFSLDGAYRQLGYIFESLETKEENNTISIEMKQTLQNLEKQLNKILTPLEINIVKKWFYDYKYPITMINEEIEKTLKRKAKNVSIIDRALFARTKETLDNEDVSKAKDLFKKLYG